MQKSEASQAITEPGPVPPLFDGVADGRRLPISFVKNEETGTHFQNTRPYLLFLLHLPMTIPYERPFLRLMPKTFIMPRSFSFFVSFDEWSNHIFDYFRGYVVNFINSIFAFLPLDLLHIKRHLGTLAMI